VCRCPRRCDRGRRWRRCGAGPARLVHLEPCRAGTGRGVRAHRYPDLRRAFIGARCGTSEIAREKQLRRGLSAYAEAGADAGRMMRAGLPVLPHQVEPLERTGTALARNAGTREGMVGAGHGDRRRAAQPDGARARRRCATAPPPRRPGVWRPPPRRSAPSPPRAGSSRARMISLATSAFDYHSLPGGQKR
jgi:hypothetical protein